MDFFFPLGVMSVKFFLVALLLFVAVQPTHATKKFKHEKQNTANGPVPGKLLICKLIRKGAQIMKLFIQGSKLAENTFFKPT